MKYGICIGFDQLDWIEIAAQSGADYIETGFAALTRADEAGFGAFREALERSGVRCEAANVFLPGELRVTGGQVDAGALRAFIEKGMRRARETGIQTVVFGSGAARSLDGATPFRRGFEQLAVFLREIAGPIAAAHGISIAVEPLCPAESNIINTVREGAMLAAASGCANVGGLGDLYHMAIVKDSCDNLRALKGCLLHSHIANPALDTPRPRRYPADEAEWDYRDFVAAAEEAGCPRCSVEAGCDDFALEASRAIALLKRL